MNLEPRRGCFACRHARVTPAPPPAPPAVPCSAEGNPPAQEAARICGTLSGGGPGTSRLSSASRQVSHPLVVHDEQSKLLRANGAIVGAKAGQLTPTLLPGLSWEAQNYLTNDWAQAGVVMLPVVRLTSLFPDVRSLVGHVPTTLCLLQRQPGMLLVGRCRQNRCLCWTTLHTACVLWASSAACASHALGDQAAGARWAFWSRRSSKTRAQTRSKPAAQCPQARGCPC